jgi:hypothetical protein
MIFLTSWRKVATPSLDFVKSTTILDITNSKEDGEGWWRVVKGCCYLPLCCRTCVRLHVKNPHHNLLNLINWRQVSLKVEWHSRGGDHEITIVFLWSTRLKRLTAWCWLPIASIIHYEMFAMRFFLPLKGVQLSRFRALQIPMGALFMIHMTQTPSRDSLTGLAVSFVIWMMDLDHKWYAGEWGRREEASECSTCD